MVSEDGTLPLPWLAEPLARALSMHSHAVLLAGPQGVGQFELALTLAQAWLCESAGQGAKAPCGHCASCHLVRARSHPDLLVLIPDLLRETLGWGRESDEESGAEKATKAKPSKEIKVDAVRSAVTFAQTSSARGRCKVVVLHPAERMNAIAANALLKTLEEPAGDARFVLSCSSPQALLPTIRSRCQALALTAPDTAVAAAWLASRGIGEPAVMLGATGGQPLEVLAWAEIGVDAVAWARLPGDIATGRAATYAAWPLPRLIEALQKLCHDLLCRLHGVPPRFFPVQSLPPDRPDTAVLAAWAASLGRRARRAEHPWNAALAAEALVQEGAHVLHSSPSGPRGRRSDSIHSVG